MTDTFVRSIICTSGLGAAWGSATAFMLLVWSFGVDLGTVIAITPTALVVGGGLGALVGLVLGLPTVLVVSPLAGDLDRCRTAGTLLAASLPMLTAAGLQLSGRDLAALAVVAAFVAVASAISAWIGLGWIYGD